MIDLDDTDRAILRALIADGGLGAKEVGARVGLSQPAAWRRIRRLEEGGVIRGRRIVLDREKLGHYAELYKRLGGYPYDQDPGRPGWAPLVPNDRWADPLDDRAPRVPF